MRGECSVIQFCYTWAKIGTQVELLKEVNIQFKELRDLLSSWSLGLTLMGYRVLWLPWGGLRGPHSEIKEGVIFDPMLLYRAFVT